MLLIQAICKEEDIIDLLLMPIMIAIVHIYSFKECCHLGTSFLDLNLSIGLEMKKINKFLEKIVCKLYIGDKT